MQRKNFLLSAIAALPLFSFTQMGANKTSRATKGFTLKNEETRFGIHYNMKGVTHNMLDIKISGKDTEQDIAVFEQTGLTPNGGPPLHIHPYQNEWF